MINDKEALAMLSKFTSEMSAPEGRYQHGSDIFQVVQQLTDNTLQAIREGNSDTVKSNLKLAENIIRQGNTNVRNVISSVFFYSVSPLLEIRQEGGRTAFRQFSPEARASVCNMYNSSCP